MRSGINLIMWFSTGGQIEAVSWVFFFFRYLINKHCEQQWKHPHLRLEI